MEPRLAFTAEYWSDSAVVCRALEDSAGPIVDQQFGLFETWAQAYVFALRLNEGLEIGPREATQIVTSSKLVTQAILETTASQRPQTKRSFFREAAGQIKVQFTIAELDLALTFCRLIKTKSTRNAHRMIRDARNALFNSLYFAIHYDLSDSDLETIATKLEMLKTALQDVSLHQYHQLGDIRSIRKQYREVHGKKVDWISHWIEEGILFFTVRFTDGKCFSVTYSPCVLLDTVDFCDMSAGDEVILKSYYQRENL